MKSRLHHKIYFEKVLLNSGVQNQGRKKLIFPKIMSSVCIKIKYGHKTYYLNQTNDKTLVFKLELTLVLVYHLSEWLYLLKT